MRRCFALLVAVAAVFVAPSAASAAGLACGDVVVTDVVLEADLVGCSTGLVVGADNITIDLNGHTIDGQSTVTAAGIEAVGRSGVRMMNGRIRSFALGVFMLDTTESSVRQLAFATRTSASSSRAWRAAGRIGSLGTMSRGRTRGSCSSPRRRSWPRTGSRCERRRHLVPRQRPDRGQPRRPVGHRDPAPLLRRGHDRKRRRRKCRQWDLAHPLGGADREEPGESRTVARVSRPTTATASSAATSRTKRGSRALDRRLDRHSRPAAHRR